MGEILLKNYIPGFIISLICFIILTIVNSQIYSNVMSLRLLVLLLVLQILFFKFLLTEKKRLTYLTFIVVFAIILFFSLPELTQKQATKKVIAMHDINIIEITTVPTQAIFEWNPFVAERAYFFKGNKTDKEISLMVNPDNGEVFIVEE